jgi:parafibromin
MSVNHKEKHYTLGSLWLYLKFKENLKDYITETQKQKIEFVESIDREKIIDFFIKDMDNINILDNEIRPKTLITLGKKTKGTHLDIFYKDKNAKPEDAKKKLMMKQQELKDKNLCIMDYIYSHEKKSLNRNSLMKPPENNLSFEHLLSMTKKIFTSEGGLKEQEEAKSFLDELIENSEGLGTSKLIIVVPSSFNEGNICDKNAKAFLHDGRYINLNMLENDEKDLVVEDNSDNNFFYKIQGKDLLFEICSNVRKFNKNDWKRVVAVFVQGDDWEFKDWPRSENPSTILQKVKGYYMKYNNNPTNKNIKKWNVQTLEISRNKRHFDASIQNKFWSSLSQFLSVPRKR